MKNLLPFYLLILAPLALLLWLSQTDLIHPTLSIGLLLFYALIYRTFTDGKKLVEKQIIRKKEIWKMIIPGYRIQHFRELYLK
ncbi:MAG: hypothetical protein WC044_14810 [Crocinitomicaceae bacterium]